MGCGRRHGRDGDPQGAEVALVGVMVAETEIREVLGCRRDVVDVGRLRRRVLTLPGAWPGGRGGRGWRCGPARGLVAVLEAHREVRRLARGLVPVAVQAADAGSARPGGRGGSREADAVWRGLPPMRRRGGPGSIRRAAEPSGRCATEGRAQVLLWNRERLP